jgi:hypothetical protein
MNVIKTSFALAAIAVLGVLSATAANATPVKYDFTVTATSGPLDGTVSHGTFSYDSSSIVPGGTNQQSGLLTALSFTWNGTHYDATTANTGRLGFDSAGNLTNFLIGNHCQTNACNIGGVTDKWVILVDGFDQFVYTVPEWLNSAYFGGLTFSPAATPVPEPAALGLFGFGALLIGAFAGLRRRMA